MNIAWPDDASVLNTLAEVEPNNDCPIVYASIQMHHSIYSPRSSTSDHTKSALNQNTKTSDSLESEGKDNSNNDIEITRQSLLKIFLHYCIQSSVSTGEVDRMTKTQVIYLI